MLDLDALQQLQSTYLIRDTMSPVSTHPLSLTLLDWYAENARDLPWRSSGDPYAIWVAEIMLQQTRVETVIPFYLRWMDAFPTVEDLARANMDEVLRHWEGLGYYRRAHNLHKAAIELELNWQGQLPETIKELKSLPGIGEYTAAAIAAIAFDVDAIALDGNLRRVIARLLDLSVDPRKPEGEGRIRAWAEDLLPIGQASAFNQALMDLGASICLPKNPLCGSCPLSNWCMAFEHGTQPIRPIKADKAPIPHYHAAAGVLVHKGKVLIGRRPEEKLLGGLWEFPGGKQDPGEDLKACLMRELKEELDVQVVVGRSLGTFDHTYTHFSISVHTFFARIQAGEPQLLDHTELAWVKPDDLIRYPMGKIDRAISRKVAETQLEL